MEYLLALAAGLGLASIPWIVWPMSRVLETKDIGYMKERLMFGFWFPTQNLSKRFNTLSAKKRKLEADLAKTIKELDEEKKHLKDKVELIDREYRHHLVDMGGKNSWQYLFRKVHVPTIAVIKAVDEERKASQAKGKTTYFTLENAPLPPEFQLDKDKGRIVKKFLFQDNSRNQQPNQNQQRKQKGNQNQQQQQNN